MILPPQTRSRQQAADVLVIGAGAAGLMCARVAGQRGRRVTVLERANKPGKKILMSGGGRCNFTNLDVQPEHFLSRNPHFCKSALSRYTQWDFISLVSEHGIAWHEKADGQLFCDHSSKDILNMLLQEIEAVGVQLRLRTEVTAVSRKEEGWVVQTDQGIWVAESLVIATGGPSIPTLGATDWGMRWGESMGHELVTYRASLVPYTAHPEDRAGWAPLSGVSLPATLSVSARDWTGDVLFTHRGLSGPVALQISNYWQPGETVFINWWPHGDLLAQWHSARQQQGRQTLVNWLGQDLPRRVADWLAGDLGQLRLADLDGEQVTRLRTRVHAYAFQPAGTEGYRTAEVTLGGLSTDDISSRTMASGLHSGLYFIGEVLDVTGHLGGYNFQWAWSSGQAAGEVV
ncbi:NAD(P)/FAD-dependent oxidoreductase [Natronospirillum operosum]|uniref:NAD(P)/FAD-dependent oxidoreductase n=1 Tax=Natronospirillum operosum TaxID=2759953 RepID=A0A4Z0WFE5_9GAMM|nr:NAD(P)/FAD-dependent oxidoreductase [Natronospirillum operosum]TGG94026.1 NAD(P)/FAD-dependent oxidoreductase [Natronospirillum operosum]